MTSVSPVRLDRPNGGYLDHHQLDCVLALDSYFAHIFRCNTTFIASTVYVLNLMEESCSDSCGNSLFHGNDTSPMVSLPPRSGHPCCIHNILMLRRVVILFLPQFCHVLGEIPSSSAWFLNSVEQNSYDQWLEFQMTKHTCSLH